MIKMALCLLMALVLGFIIGGLLSKLSIKKKYEKELTQLRNNLLKSEDAVEKLKEINLTQKEEIGKGKAQNIGFRRELEKKSQELWKTEKKLTLSKQSLLQKNIKLERLLEQEEREIQGLEKVLIKADDVIDKQNKKITLLEKEQAENSSDKEHEELLITKDQFSHIEVQLLEYQKEIRQLKELNKRLKKGCASKISSRTEVKIEEPNSELDDSAIVKLFGDTYKKIIKS